MTTPSDPERDDKQPADGVSLEKGDPAGEAPFDPYRFGKPDHPIPAEYAPPGYTGPVIPAASPYPPADPWNRTPAGGTTNPFDNPPGTPYPPSGQYPQGTYPPGQYPPAQYPPGQYPPGRYGGPSGPYGGPPPPWHGYAQPRSGNGKAVTSLVLGILSIVCCWLLFFNAVLVIPALVFGFLALGEARRPGGTGHGIAVAGVVCAVIGALLATMFTVLIFRAANRCGGFSENNQPGFSHCVRQNFW